MEPEHDIWPGGGADLVRPRRLLIVALVLLVAVVFANATMSSAVEVQHRMRVVTTDLRVPEDRSTTTTAPPTSAGAAPTTSASETSTQTSPSTSLDVTTTSTPTTADDPTSATTSTVAVLSEAPPTSASAPPDPALVSRPIPVETTPPANAPASPYTSSTTPAGYFVTDLGCASGTGASALDAFFAARIGPVLGHDYQHVYPLGGNRYLWLFQDTFVDYTGVATTLGHANFMHNSAMVQAGACFTLYHRGSARAPSSFEPGTGENRLVKWFWPMGGELVGNRLVVFWAQMQDDGYDPTPPNGLGWHPEATWLAVYDANTLARLSFNLAPNSGTKPIYGYAVASDNDFTYLFGNTFEQNLQREGGWLNGPHSGTNMWLARVPKGQLASTPEYRTADGWSPDPTQAVPIVSRYWAENPMQPRYLHGEWVAVTKVDGYWGDSLSVDVANDPWGPWTTVESRGIAPRGGDPLMNTYHAYLMPWLDGSGSLVVSISQNARDMARDAWPDPARYRLAFFRAALVAPPPRVDPTTTTSSSVDDSSTSAAETSTTAPDTTSSTEAVTTTATTTPATSTTVPVTTSTSPATTTSSPATTSTSSTSTTSTSVADSSTSTSTSTSTTSTTPTSG